MAKSGQVQVAALPPRLSFSFFFLFFFSSKLSSKTCPLRAECVPLMMLLLLPLLMMLGIEKKTVPAKSSSVIVGDPFPYLFLLPLSRVHFFKSFDQELLAVMMMMMMISAVFL